MATKSPGAGTPLADAASGLVVHLYLLAPDILFEDLGVLNHVLADADFLLDDRPLGHHDLFFGDWHRDLVIADLGFRSLARERNPLHRNLFVPGRYFHALAIGPNVLFAPRLAGSAPAGAGG